MPDRVAVIGAGSWGMAIAALLDSSGYDVALWEFDPAACKQLTDRRGDPDKLPGFTLPASIELTDSLTEVLAGHPTVALAVPAQHLRSVLVQGGENWRRASCLVSLAKGIENKTLLRMSEVIRECTGRPLQHIVCLSGPSHAEEVVQYVPTTVVAAGEDETLVARVQEGFSVDNFRVYSSPDLIGVELGGSLKNVVAIAAGIADGLGMGDNTKGALLTRGLAEIARLGAVMGAQAETFAGLSGIGDLVATCCSRHSRNRRVGERIGRGEKLPDILASLHMVAEGVQTTQSAFELAQKHKVEMPITAEVYRVLFQGREPAEAVASLLGRELRAEIWH